MAPIKAVFGGASINPGKYNTEAEVEELLDNLLKNGVTNIDTARLYPGSEEAIGKAPKRTEFVIDTKLIGGFVPGSLTRENILKDSQDSLDKAQIKQFDILYFHSPDENIPLEESLEAINEVHKKGIFKRFGLSNYSAEQVQQVYDLAKSKGWVLPSVYQGNYNPIARRPETDLFPTLRKLGIAFYAYSPIAGGFLVKTKQQLEEGVSRFSESVMGGLYNKLYNKDVFKNILSDWNDIAAAEGVSNAELAYRWVGYNSHVDASKGDAVIFGASSLKQVDETTAALKKGPLSKEAAEKIEKVWQQVANDAVIDNYQTIKGN